MKHLQCSILSQGTICFTAFLEILVNLSWPLLKLNEGLTFGQKKIRQQILSEKVLACMSTCKKRELPLNNTTVVIMKLSSFLKPIFYMKCTAVLCVC